MNVLEIVIGNKRYTVKTDEDKEHVEKVERLINNQLENFTASRKFNESDKLIFTSFFIGDKYVKLISAAEQREAQVRLEIEENNKKIINLYKENEAARQKNEELSKLNEDYKITSDVLISEKASLQDKLKKLEKEQNDRELLYVQNENTIAELRGKISEYNEKCLELSKDRDSFLKEINAAEVTKTNLNNRITKLVNKLNEKDQIITNNDKTIANNKRVINELNQKLNDINEQNKKDEELLQTLNKDKEFLTNKAKLLEQKNQEKDTIIGQNYKLIEELKILKEELTKNNERIDDEKEKILEDLLMANSEKESLNSSMNEIHEKLNRKDADIYQMELQLKELKKENEELKADNSNLKKENEELTQMLDIETASN